MALTLTENQSLTFSTSNNACLDFLFHVIEGSAPGRTIELLEKSWEQSPLNTMKLIMNLRDIRGGKGIRSQSLLCLQWLYKNQFENLMLNLIHFDKFGCWKDYLNLLVIALFDVLPYDFDTSSRQTRKYKHVTPYDRVILKSFPKTKRRELEEIKTEIGRIERKYLKENEWIKEKIHSRKLDNGQKLGYKNLDKFFPEKKLENPNRKVTTHYKLKTNKAKLRKLNEYRSEYFEKNYKENSKFQKLYDRIIELFGEQLNKDYLNYNYKKFDQISLASKWLPNRGRFFDKYLFLYPNLAKKFFEFNKEAFYELDSAKRNEEKYLIRMLSRMCTTLRKNSKIPEIPMSSRDWDQIDYNCVPSMAMLRYRKAFIRNDNERFMQFIDTKPAKAGALTPADLIKQLDNNSVMEGSLFHTKIPLEFTEEQMANLKTIDNQWQSMVDQIKSSGSLIFSNTVAVCDVSGSMMCSDQNILPIHASIGLTLFLTEISDSVWNKCCISFSEEPKIHKIDMNGTLLHRAKQLLSCDFGYNTDLNKVFNLILKRAKDMKLTEEQMPKVLFIFTDMEFDCAMQGKTNYEACQIEYEKAGYKLPFIIFWNLKGEKAKKSTPVQYNQDGVMLLSGFSAQTFKFLFTAKDIWELTPIKMLSTIINNPRYDCLKIIEKPQILD